MEIKICNICNEKDQSKFAKWKRVCKKCNIDINKRWKEKNRKIIKGNCIDCNISYETIIYSTQKPNIRCRSCSIRSKIPILINKECRICNCSKSIDNFYKNYKVCKPCLFKKRNKRYNDRLKTDVIFKIRHNLKVNLRKQFKSIGSKKKGKTIEILGCSITEFKLYLENRFDNWMNWDNYGLYNGENNFGWDIDHIIPISSAVTIDDLIKLNHYTNFQPLCSYINRDLKKDNLNYEN